MLFKTSWIMLQLLKNGVRNIPNAGYGFSFMEWIASDSGKLYNSWGNGAAMRVIPVF
jgi:ADP-ribosylglycohydrolase